MAPNRGRKAVWVVLAEVDSVIVGFSLEQPTGAQPVRALIGECHLDGSYHLKLVLQPIASLSLIRRGLLGVGDHRPSGVAEVASAFRKLNALMCDVLQGSLKCLMGSFLWRIDDESFWSWGISILAFRNVHDRDPLV